MDSCKARGPSAWWKRSGRSWPFAAGFKQPTNRRSDPQLPRSKPPRDRLLGCVMLRAEKMQRNVGLIAYHPAIVSRRPGRDVKQHAGPQLVNRTIVHRRCGTAGDYQPNMLDIAARSPYARAHVFGPLPSGLVDSPADGHATEANEFESSLFERPHFIRMFEPL